MNLKSEMSAEDIQSRLREGAPDTFRQIESLKSWCAGKDVLDFGCGLGGFLKAISSVAKSAVGVEVGLSERNYLKSIGLTVEDKIYNYEKTFDVITLFHTFHFLIDPKKWLRTFAKFLKTGGFMFIEIPNSNDALLSLYKNKAFEDFTFTACQAFLYTKESLTALINADGNFIIEDDGQVQRYPLSNHLYWLAAKKPGGHKRWDFLNSQSLNDEYKKVLEKYNLCDTLFFRLRKI